MLIRQTAPEAAQRGMHDINSSDTAYDRFVRLERSAKYAVPNANAAEQIPSSKWARLFKPINKLLGLGETEIPAAVSSPAGLRLASAGGMDNGGPRRPPARFATPPGPAHPPRQRASYPAPPPPATPKGAAPARYPPAVTLWVGKSKRFSASPQTQRRRDTPVCKNIPGQNTKPPEAGRLRQHGRPQSRTGFGGACRFWAAMHLCGLTFGRENYIIEVI